MSAVTPRIHSLALLMVRRYGNDAAKNACEHAAALLRVGYFDDCAMWLRVGRTIVDLQKRNSPPSARLN